MPSPLPRRNLAVAVLLVAMAAIFVADTATDYAVAAAGFYTVIILAAARLLPARRLVLLAAACIGLTMISFTLSGFGVYQIGLVNSGIGIVTIGVATYLALKMEAARSAAQEAQAQLLRVARASTLGELTASIAHEVNQPLAAVVTSGDACQRWLAQEPPNLDKARQAVTRILDDAHRASDVIARVRGLTRGEPPRRSAFDLNRAAEEILALAGAELDRHGIAVILEFAPELPPVNADRIQVQQVIGNLVLNAVEAMDAVTASRRSLILSTAAADRAHVRLSVTDSGAGLPAEAADRLFDPFWTTKPGGLGLGLSISRSIVEANGGRIHAEHREGGGTRFEFELPIAAENGRD